MSRTRRGIAVAFALSSAVTAAAADPYPNRIVRLIVPFPAGGSNDVAARIIAPHLEQALGQTVIVDNRPAAGGIVGSDVVAKAPPDGHMLLLVASSHTVTPALNTRLPYEHRARLRADLAHRHQCHGVLRQPRAPCTHAH
jgi:tripartite-type tricarboxylate transporter receptor subunit TctC